MASDEKPSFVETYRIEEFKAARIEIERRLAGMRALERHLLVGDVAIYAALLFHDRNPATASLVDLAWWLPPIIGMLAASLWRNSSEMVGQLGAYIRSKEPNEEGWEHFLLARRRSRWPWVRFLWNVSYWVMMIAGTAAVACFETTKQAPLTALAGLGFGAIAVGLAWQVAPGEKIEAKTNNPL